MYLQLNDLGWFYLLTPEEQLSDIREFYQQHKDNLTPEHLDHLSEMLDSNYCEERAIANRAAMLHRAIENGTSLIYDQQQVDELVSGGSTLAMVSPADVPIFEYWARENSFYYATAAEHRDGTRTYIVWQRVDEPQPQPIPDEPQLTPEDTQIVPTEDESAVAPPEVEVEPEVEPIPDTEEPQSEAERF